ncbi:MAG: hypothetical protein JWN52_5722 [Actinomycetia bacterium]|nr:hypothetical protein [Actinomycetes bacterium]
MAAPVAQTGSGNVVTNSVASASSISATKPANVADGDLFVAAVYFRNAAGTVTPPSGWALFGTLNTANETFGMYYKAIPTAASEAATSYSFSTTGGASRNLIILFRVTGALLSSPQDAVGSFALFTGTSSIIDPAVTAVDSSALLLAFNISNITSASQPVFTAPAGMSEVGQIAITNSTPASSSIQVAQQALSSSGSTGTRTFTMSPAAANSGGFMVTIAPPVHGSASLSATSSLTASGAVGALGSVSLAGAGSLAATNNANFTGSAAMTAAGTLSADTTTALSVLLADTTWGPSVTHHLEGGSWVP